MPTDQRDRPMDTDPTPGVVLPEQGAEFDVMRALESLPKLSAEEINTSILNILGAMKRDDETPPTSVITFPDLVPDPRAGKVLRYRCIEAPVCTWQHFEPLDCGPVGPLKLPADFTVDDVTAAITAQANARSEAYTARLTGIFEEHLDREH